MGTNPIAIGCFLRKISKKSFLKFLQLLHNIVFPELIHFEIIIFEKVLQQRETVVGLYIFTQKFEFLFDGYNFIFD